MKAKTAKVQKNKKEVYVMKKFTPLFLAFAVLFGICFYGLSLSDRPNNLSPSEATSVAVSDSEAGYKSTASASTSRTPETVDLSDLSAPYGTKPAASVDDVVCSVFNYVAEFEIVPCADQDYASYASSDMYRIWNKLHTQAIEHPEKNEIKLCSEDLTTLQHYMIEVALPDSASVPDDSYDIVDEIGDYHISYIYDDSHTAKFRIGIWYVDELYLSLDGNSMIYVTT